MSEISNLIFEKEREFVLYYMGDLSGFSKEQIDKIFDGFVKCITEIKKQKVGV